MIRPTGHCRSPDINEPLREMNRPGIETVICSEWFQMAIIVRSDDHCVY